MKIAIFHDILAGGAKRSIFEFAKNLKSRGHYIALFAPYAEDQFLLADDYADVRFNFSYRPVFDFGEKTFFFSPFVFLEIPMLFSFSKKLAAKIDQSGYDAVFVHHSRFTQAPALLRYLKTNSIYYCHEPLRFVSEPHPPLDGKRETVRRCLIGLSKPQQKLLRRLEANHLKKASLVLTNSFFTSENIYRCYGISSFPCYQGVDLNTFKPAKIVRDRYVISVGQMNRWKAQEFLVRSLALEAMACGTPVVAVKEGGIRETVLHGQTGLLTLRNHTEFAGAVESLLNSPQRLEDMSKRARENMVAQWTWAESARVLERYMNQIQDGSIRFANRN